MSKTPTRKSVKKPVKKTATGDAKVKKRPIKITRAAGVVEGSGAQSNSSRGAAKKPSVGKGVKKKAQSPQRAQRSQVNNGGQLPPQGPSLGKRVSRFLFYWMAVLGVWGGILGTLGFLYLAHDLPDLENLPEPGAGDQAVVIKAANGATLVRQGPVYGDWVPYEKMPDSLVHAVLAIEDRSFFEHLGIDGKGLARAALTNLRAGRIRGGGSTITQQLAKNLFLTSRQTFTRKAQEILLAVWLERTFTKQEILTLYLNRVYFGGGTYGIDAAAHKYFGRSATSLTVAQSAMIAGLLKAPSKLAPHINPDGAWERAHLVLNAMVEVGALTSAARDKIKQRRPYVAESPLGSHVRYFTDWAITKANRLIPDGKTGKSLIIHTTLDPAMQRAAYDAVSRGIATEGKGSKASQGALVALDHDGAVRALVGGTNYGRSQYNRATLAERQPGSAFKLFSYLAGFEAGLSPASRYTDKPINIDGWTPKNYSGKFHGEMTLREAFARSINTIAVEVSEHAGRAQVRDMAKRMGIKTSIQPIASLPLGTEEVRLIDLASSYAVVASGGYSADAYGITEITALNGEVLYRRGPKRPIAVISREAAKQAADMLTSVITWGSGTAAKIDRPAGGKSGTSQDSRDAVFVGFSSDVTAAVWVGNDNGQPMKNVTGGGLPARIWQKFMVSAHVGVPVRPLQADADLYREAATGTRR